MAGPDFSAFGTLVGPAPAGPPPGAPRKGATPDFSGGGVPMPSTAAQRTGQAAVDGSLSTNAMLNSLLPGLGDALTATKRAVVTAFPGATPYLPNTDTVRQFVRQATGGISDAAVAGGAAAGTAVHNLATGDRSASTGDVYNAARQAEIARTAQHKGGVNTAAGTLGGLSTLALGLGAPAKAAQAANAAVNVSRTARLLAAAPKLAKGVAVGAGIGGASGAANAPTWQQTPEGALTGAEIGAAVAPVAGAVKMVASTPLVQGAGRRLGAVAQTLGAGVKNAVVHAPTEATEDSVQSALPAAADIVRGMMGRSRVSLEDLENAPGAARDMTAAEAIGPEAVNRVTALRRRPGATANVAQPQLEGRSANMLDRFAGDVYSSTNISPEDARNAVDATVAQGRAQVKPLFDKALGIPGPVWNVELANLAQRPVIRDSIGAAVDSLKNAGLDPLAPGLAIDPDTGAQVTGEDLKSLLELQPTANAWDLVRRKAQSLVQQDQTGQTITTGKLGIYNTNLETAGNDLSRTLRDAIPGYGDALDQSADYLKVQDAYKRAANMLQHGTPLKTVTDYVSGLSDPEKQAVRLSFARQLYDMIDQGTMRPNVFLGAGQGVRQGLAGKLATVYRPDVAEKLTGAATAERDLSRNAARMAPLANSTTGAAIEVDEPGSPMAANLGKQLSQGNLKGAGMMALLGPAGRTAAAPGAIALRDAQGRLLLMSPPRLAETLRSLPPRNVSPFSIDGAGRVVPVQAGLLGQNQDQGPQPYPQ